MISQEDAAESILEFARTCFGSENVSVLDAGARNYTEIHIRATEFGVILSTIHSDISLHIKDYDFEFALTREGLDEAMRYLNATAEGRLVEKRSQLFGIPLRKSLHIGESDCK